MGRHSSDSSDFWSAEMDHLVVFILRLDLVLIIVFDLVVLNVPDFYKHQFYDF